MTVNTISMKDYKWPISDSQMYRSDDDCCIYHKTLPLRCLPMVEDCRLYPYNAWHLRNDSGFGGDQPLNVINQYNNLHCSCHECQRFMKCFDTEGKLHQNDPITCTTEDKELSNLHKMGVIKNRFTSSYNDSYGKQYNYSLLDNIHLTGGEDHLFYPIQGNEKYPQPPNPLSHRITSIGNDPAFIEETRNKEKAIMKNSITRPWRSEYMDGISRTGQRIMNEHLLENSPRSPLNQLELNMLKE